MTSSEGAVEGVQRLLELLDRRQVEVVGRLVEDEQVDPAGLQQRERRRGSVRPGDSVAGGPMRPGAAPSPNFASRVRTSAVGQSGTSPAKASTERLARRGTARAPGRPRPPRTPEPSDAPPGRSGRRPSSTASSVDLPPPFGPVTATRSTAVQLQVDGPEAERAPLGRRPPAGVATTSPERGAAAMTNCSAHSLRGSSTTSRRSIIRSVCRALAACFSELSARKLRTDLSLSVALRRAFLHALLHPRALRARPAPAGALAPAA